MTNNIDENLKEYFQRNIQLTLKHKPFKKGKLINFKTSGCYVSFIMLTEKKKETFEIPFPYIVKVEPNKLTFDYMLKSLSEHDYELLVNLQSVTQVKNCKFYNTILTITPLN